MRNSNYSLNIQKDAEILVFKKNALKVCNFLRGVNNLIEKSKKFVASGRPWEFNSILTPETAFISLPDCKSPLFAVSSFLSLQINMHA
ncbi:hypothetical protein OGH69_10430 [Flavobacterium sp. MFBS3-15]|uniref:hypothetical protein n=1 Tax=Flavobacterium sp. MFBS3-15 TaxID=2989816 RepID=UPI0022366228|nr:hypothetical protein [Flavobacterium sp. MFBS3-15]MCW4469382.1 hypothetical protein [Flavobacterium sp. MFBS3-15]